MHTCKGRSVLQHTCGGRRTALQSWFSRHLDGSPGLHFHGEDLCLLSHWWAGSFALPSYSNLQLFHTFSLLELFMVPTFPNLLLFSLSWHYIFLLFLFSLLWITLVNINCQKYIHIHFNISNNIYVSRIEEDDISCSLSASIRFVNTSNIILKWSVTSFGRRRGSKFQISNFIKGSYPQNINIIILLFFFH